MPAVLAVDACRTPIGKIKGALAGVRPDHLTAEILQALLRRNDWLDPASVDDVSGAPPTRPARTTATGPGWACCWQACRSRCRAPP